MHIQASHPTINLMSRPPYTTTTSYRPGYNEFVYVCVVLLLCVFNSALADIVTIKSGKAIAIFFSVTFCYVIHFNTKGSYTEFTTTK